jgi:excisionase family DNA binding protein
MTARLVTVDQAAEALSVSVHTIRAWIAERRITCVRLGRAVRVPQSEIARLIEQGTIPARDYRGRATV